MSETVGTHHRDGKRSKGWRGYVLPCLIAVPIVVAVIFGYLYAQSQNRLAQLEQGSDRAKQEADRIIAKVGAHMVLPSERPTVATVQDKSKLVGQAFFKSSENGDRVLMYTGAQKAILYRPSVDRVIDIAHLDIKEGT